MGVYFGSDKGRRALQVADRDVGSKKACCCVVARDSKHVTVAGDPLQMTFREAYS